MGCAAELHKRFSSMIPVALFKRKKALVVVVCLLVITVLLYRWGNNARSNIGLLTKVPKVEVRSVAAGVLEQSRQQGMKIIQEKLLPQDVIDGVEKFVFFIGWARSGHSVVGSLMDAHPNMLIANEFTIFYQLIHNLTNTTKAAIFNALYTASIRNAKGVRSDSRKGYTLGIKDFFQGKFSELKVIGDKRGEDALERYTHTPESFTKLYKRLSEEVLQIPLMAIQVIRNPYDIIATQVLYDKYLWKWKTRVSTEDKCKVTSRILSTVLRQADAIKRLRKDFNLTVLEIHYADLVNQPRLTMKTICQFLDLECYEEYLDKCEEKVFGKVSITRNLVEWTPDLLGEVENAIKDHPFFERYTFYSD